MQSSKPMCRKSNGKTSPCNSPRKCSIVEERNSMQKSVLVRIGIND